MPRYFPTKNAGGKKIAPITPTPTPVRVGWASEAQPAIRYEEKNGVLRLSKSKVAVPVRRALRIERKDLLNFYKIKLIRGFPAGHELDIVTQLKLGLPATSTDAGLEEDVPEETEEESDDETDEETDDLSDEDRVVLPKERSAKRVSKKTRKQPKKTALKQPVRSEMSILRERAEKAQIEENVYISRLIKLRKLLTPDKPYAGEKDKGPDVDDLTSVKDSELDDYIMKLWMDLPASARTMDESRDFWSGAGQ